MNDGPAIFGGGRGRAEQHFFGRGIPFYFRAITASATKVPGAISFNNATLSSVTNISMSIFDSNGRGVSALQAEMTVSGCEIRVYKAKDDTVFLRYKANSLGVVNPEYYDVGGNYIASSGTFYEGDKVFVDIIASGRGYITTQILTSGTSMTTGAQTRRIFIRMVGGGGAGGNATGTISAAGGGGAGGYAEKTFSVSPSTAYSYTIGGAGGNSTFVVGATTVTANGGSAGPNVSSNGPAVGAGGAGGAVSTNGDVNCGGSGGSFGFSDGTRVASGAGGASQFGGGGNGRITDGAGVNAVGYGAGGGGGCATGATDRAGGTGAAGIIIVDEYE